jgi:hypothetical protein
VNSSSDYFAYLYSPTSERMLHQKRISVADWSHLRQQTVETNCKMNTASWITRLQGVCVCVCVDYCCFIGSKLQHLCCIRLWHCSLLIWMFPWYSRCMIKSGPYVI